MTKSVKITIALLLLACVIIAAFPLLSVKNSEFGGADGAVKEALYLAQFAKKLTIIHFEDGLGCIAEFR